MAKSLYSALFDWIVLRINHALLNKKDMEESVSVRTTPARQATHDVSCSWSGTGQFFPGQGQGTDGMRFSGPSTERKHRTPGFPCRGYRFNP